MKGLLRQTEKAKISPEPIQAVETFSLKSLDAARKMFQSADHQAARKNYSAVLVKESHDLGTYIVRKRTTAKRKHLPSLAPHSF